MISIKFTIEGEDHLNRTLTGLSASLSDFKVPLKQSTSLLMSDINNAFDTSGRSYDFGGWAPLSNEYASWKSKRYSNSGILTRTGEMRKSFRNIVDSTMMKIWNTSPYFKYHQSNQPRSKMPRRIMLYFNQNTRREIIKYFQEYINL